VTYQVPVSETVLTKAEYEPKTKKLTLTGKSLAVLTGVTVKSGSTTVAASFKAATDGLTSLATLAKPPAVAGTYTVAGVDASGLSFSTTFVVEASTVTDVTYSGTTLTVTGTVLENLTSTTVTKSGTTTATPVTLTADEDGGRGRRTRTASRRRPPRPWQRATTRSPPRTLRAPPCRRPSRSPRRRPRRPRRRWTRSPSTTPMPSRSP
jgi:hypothetical protein